MNPHTTTREIKVSYRSVDHFSKTRTFKTLEGARKFAQKYVGQHPEMGGWYAVSADGIGRVTVDGVTLQELFPSEEEVERAEESARWAALSDDELAEALEGESEDRYWLQVDRSQRATCGWGPTPDYPAARELARRNALLPHTLEVPVPAPERSLEAAR